MTEGIEQEKMNHEHSITEPCIQLVGTLTYLGPRISNEDHTTNEEKSSIHTLVTKLSIKLKHL